MRPLLSWVPSSKTGRVLLVIGLVAVSCVAGRVDAADNTCQLSAPERALVISKLAEAEPSDDPLDLDEATRMANAIYCEALSKGTHIDGPLGWIYLRAKAVLADPMLMASLRANRPLESSAKSTAK